jgi:hypothetical protein
VATARTVTVAEMQDIRFGALNATTEHATSKTSHNAFPSCVVHEHYRS